MVNLGWGLILYMLMLIVVLCDGCIVGVVFDVFEEEFDVFVDLCVLFNVVLLLYIVGFVFDV